MVVIAFFVPVWGFMAIIVADFCTRFKRAGKKNSELESMRRSLVEVGSNLAPVNESENVVPLEDALLMDDSSVKRSVIMDVLMEDSKKYVKVLDQARMNEDAEVVHYATTAMVELSKEYELKAQEYSSMYAENPLKPGLLDEYVDFLEYYLSSNMLQGKLLEIIRNTFIQLLTEKIERSGTKYDYHRMVVHLLNQGYLSMADEVISQMEKVYKDDDDTWLMRFRYYYYTNAGSRIQEMIREVKTSDRFYSHEIRQLVEFWNDDNSIKREQIV